MRQDPNPPRVQNPCMSYGNTIISARTLDFPVEVLTFWTWPGSRGLIGFDELTIGHVRPTAAPGGDLQGWNNLEESFIFYTKCLHCHLTILGSVGGPR